MKTVMISGHFDPFTDAHLDYMQQAMSYGVYVLCVVSTDKQLKMKKGFVNIPEVSRMQIVDLTLNGLHVPHRVVLNVLDKETPMIADALRWWKPDVLCRGGDKKIEDMPPEELKACEELGIKVVHAEFRIDRHGAGIKW